MNELRALRVDVRAACLVAKASADELHADLGGTLDVAAASPFPVTNDAFAGIEANTDPEANPPADQAPVVAAVDAAQLELDAALWFLAGLIVALFAGSVFVREVLG